MQVENKEKSADSKQGMVIYCDGGCRPNPGPGGWGLHGYLFNHQTPKKGTGLSDYILTAQGYLPKAKEDKQTTRITPVHYVDGYGTFSIDISNNLAEIAAAINALRHALQYDIDSLQIYTDSEHVCKGVNEWTLIWRKNNWLKSDGMEPANVAYWRELNDLRDVLVHRGVSVSFDWVKGHTDALKEHDTIIGNVVADRLATVAVFCSRAERKDKVNVFTSSPDGYWNYTPDKHPFIANRRMYFNTMPETITPGVYYLGEHGKDDDLLGKRVSDGAYSVIQLGEPDPALELIRNHQAMAAGAVNSIVMVRLDRVFHPDTHRELSLFGSYALDQPNPYRLDLQSLDKEPVTREFRPPKLAMRAVESLTELSARLDQYLSKHPLIVCTDLTETLYETSVNVSKKGEVTSSMKLKSEYNVGFAAFQAEAAYHVDEGQQGKAVITLTLGIDLLDRNALKRLESLNPKVTLITWLEAPHVFRYATVVETATDRGIWAGVYSNLRVVPQ